MSCSSSKGTPDSDDGMTMTPMLPAVNGIAASPQTSVVAEDNGDTFANLHPQAENVFSPITAMLFRPNDISSGVEIDLPGDYVDWYLKSISSDGEGGFQMTFLVPSDEDGADDEEVRIDLPREAFNTDRRSFHVDEEGGDVDLPLFSDISLWSSTDSFNATLADDTSNESLTDGSSFLDYLDVLDWGGDVVEGRLNAYTVYGVQTKTDSLPVGTAIYAWNEDTSWQEQGQIYLRLWDKSVSSPRQFLQGLDLSLTADFNRSRISGSADEVWITSGLGWEKLPDSNSLRIENGKIVANRFHAELRGVDSGAADNQPERSVNGISGDMIGGFYGPAAEEIGGTVVGTKSDSQVFRGYFYTKKTSSE